MCENQHRYRLKVDEKLIGSVVRIKEAPELVILYAGVRNSLCPSQYLSEVRCFWEGDVALTLRINGEDVTLNDHDAKKGNKVVVGGYEFIGQQVEVEEKSRDKTYFVFTVCQLKNTASATTQRTHRLGEPFMINFTESAGTGYSWQVTLPEGIEQIADSHWLGKGEEAALPGGSSTHTYVLKGVKRGKHTIVARFNRPWEKTVMPGDRSVTYKVMIV